MLGGPLVAGGRPIPGAYGLDGQIAMVPPQPAMVDAERGSVSQQDGPIVGDLAHRNDTADLSALLPSISLNTSTKTGIATAPTTAAATASASAMAASSSELRSGKINNGFGSESMNVGKTSAQKDDATAQREWKPSTNNVKGKKHEVGTNKGGKEKPKATEVEIRNESGGSFSNPHV